MKIKGCVFFLLVILIVGLFGFAKVNQYNDAISKNTKNGESVLVTIDKGESPTSIKDKLISSGVLQDQDIIFGFSAYKLYEYFSKFDSKIQAGSYTIPKGSSIKEVAQILQQADVEQSKITIKEGLRLEEVADEISRILNDGTNKKSKFNKNDFINMAKNTSNSSSISNSNIVSPTLQVSSRDFLNSRPPGDLSLEGYLFPDTYFVSPDASAQDIINIMLDNFKTKVYVPNLGAIKINKYTLHQLLTVASIVQREVQTPQDMALVSDIFFRRNAIGIPLGSDVTVLYALGYSQSEGVWWRKTEPNIKELDINSPYNTRRFAGLPPGPIDSPGLVTFMATLVPKANDYLYFLTDSNGVTRYAKTSSEHEANIRKYLR